MKAIWNGAVIAQSDDVVEVEGNTYFPLASLNRRFVVDSSTRTTCPWKGIARYYHLHVGGAVNTDAAWDYPQPKAGAEVVTGRVAFWRGVQVQP